MILYWNKIETINSILISVMLACNSVAILLDFIPKSVVFSIYVPFILIIGLNIGYLIKRNYTHHFIFVVYVLLFFLIPFFLGNTESQLIHYFLDFFIFGIPFLFLPFVPVNYKTVFKSLSILGLLLFPSLLKIDLIEEADSGIWMTISYNVIKFIVPALIVIFLSIAPAFPYLIKNSVTFLSKHNIYSYSLNRIEKHLESNTSQSKGRIHIYNMAKTGIVKKPIWGNGAASF